MRKLYFTFVAIYITCFTLQAQLTVSSTGAITMPNHVAIGDSLPNSTTGLRVAVSTDELLNYGIHSLNSYTYEFQEQLGCHIGVLGKVSANMTVPIFPPKGGGSLQIPEPFNAGIAGLSTSGCAIYGSTGTTLPNSWNMGPYAGYFNGDVKVSGTLSATTVSTSSDLRFKNDIRDIDESAIKALLSLHPVTYTFKRDSMLYLDEGEEKRTHYGMVAQEVKKVLPELVNEDGAGYLSINYIELIPLLVNVIQKQQEQIEELQKVVNAPQVSKIARMYSSNKTQQPQLQQNTPNPFSQNTTIGYYLPTDTREASIHIYDMNGTEFVAFSIDTFGQGELTINAGTLRAGMYLYSLIADGELIDTKQMILTK